MAECHDEKDTQALPTTGADPGTITTIMSLVITYAPVITEFLKQLLARRRNDPVTEAASECPCDPATRDAIARLVDCCCK